MQVEMPNPRAATRLVLLLCPLPTEQGLGWPHSPPLPLQAHLAALSFSFGQPRVGTEVQQKPLRHPPHIPLEKWKPKPRVPWEGEGL